jgi:hypothetical protein
VLQRLSTREIASIGGGNRSMQLEKALTHRKQALKGARRISSL